MTVKVIVLSVLLAAGCSAAANDTTGAGAAQVMLKPLVKKLSDRIALSLLEYRDTLAYPRSTKPDGKWKTVPVRDWTSGFFPGILWSMSELAADTSFRLPAARWTEGLTPIQFYTGSHDIGFITFCSFGNGFRLTGNEAYKKVILQSAQTLTTRYNPTIGCIKSWDHTAWPYPVIIDNMMNLELLFWASKNGGTQHMYDIAIRHAEKTMLHHFRPDGSTYHVVGYDTTNGDVISRGTHQGYADESTWSRGQAWAIYGFTMAYRYTHDERFLQTAQKAAEYFLLHLPADKVPYWDFNAPNIPNEPRDASAAAIASSALFELSTYGRDQAMREKYYAGAVSILRSLSSPPYFTDTSRSLGLLNHAVGNKPANQEVDVSLIYGDYYFLEALTRYQRSKSQGGGLLGGRAEPRPLDLAAWEKQRVIDAAENFVHEDPQTITSFPAARSAGGKHDFFSEGDYWWPDPANPDGPYIQKDGLTNPDNFVAHRKAMIRFSIQTAALTTAYTITRDRRYADAAVRHLLAWFVNDDTKMNPHMLYAQAIKGKFTGRGIGIIDTIHLIEVAQSIMALEDSGVIAPAYLAAIKNWFRAYLEWLTIHQYGKDEMNAKNNHGTCWTMQVAAFAKLVKDEGMLELCRQRFKTVLLPGQMAADGSFPLELKRTKPYSYSLFNLDAMAAICQIASTEKDNLWNFTLPDGRGMRRAIEFMYPFIADKSSWKYQPDVLYFDYFPIRQPSLLFGGIAYDEKKYIDLWKSLEADPTNEEVIRNTPIRQPLLWVQKTAAPAEVRTSQLINDDWLYLEDAVQSVDQLGESSQQWKKVSLPHTWNATDALDLEPGYRRSSGWYKKELFIPQSGDSTIIRLHFEGVNMKCEVYVNGKLAGSHRGGFVGFDVDLTPLVTKGAKNLFEVKADNSYDPFLIPSQKSDFVLYGGITRNVRLDVLPRTHIEKMLIQTPSVSAKTASVNAQLFAACDAAMPCVIECAIKDNEGAIVARQTTKIGGGHGIQKIAMKFTEVANPKLWSPSSPYLYTVEARILKNGVVVDKISDRIGLRWYEFKEHGAFYLNGERLLLRGTHRHEELSGWGNALTDSIHRSDMRMIKEMGANFVRLAHYPQAPEVYRACDELGILVWDENPWCRGGVGPQLWRESTKNIFTEMILQNYNHPSIILWSIGNESDWLPDFPGGDNKDSLRAFAKVLNALAKSLDPYRPTTARKFPAAEKIVDVFSPSIWSGWYSDVYKNYEKALLKARDAYPRMLHAEYGGDSHVGRHTEHPISGEGKVTTTGGDEPVNKFKSSSIANIGDWSETYIVDLFDWYLHVTQNLDWFSGSAQWIFRDFTTPLRPENPIPYVNQKGLVDMNNNPKDAYYVFKSYWTTSPKFNYIESHTWTERHGAVNEKKDVKVFSNCGEVELFVNGASLGRIKKDIAQYPASGLHWQAVFAEGRNMLRAVGYDDGKQSVVDSMNVFYSTQPVDKPDDFVLQQEKLSNGDRLITVYAVDKAGNHCTELNTRVYFSALSGGSLLSDRGTPIGSSVIELANGRARIVFKPIPSQKAVIEVRSQEMKGTYLTIDD